LPGAGAEYKPLNRALGKAVHDYGMIRDGDRILVGLSGGADSLTLLWLLAERRRRVPVRYELRAAYVDLGFGDAAGRVLEPFCDALEVPFHEAVTDYGPLSHSPVNRENPCFLCARLRRKSLLLIAEETGCGTLALGHNKDDLIETLFLNICYAGEIGTMMPAQSFFKGRFTVIRPLAYAEKERIRRFAAGRNLPVVANPCPSSGSSSRDRIGRLLAELYRENPKIRGNIFRAMRHVRPEHLLK
jgi:tRNA 2-thiocytidine biosynthesis protein TtcA